MIGPDAGAVALDKAMESGLLGYPDIVGKEVEIGDDGMRWTVEALGPLGLVVWRHEWDQFKAARRLVGEQKIAYVESGDLPDDVPPTSIARRFVPWTQQIAWSEDIAPPSE